MIFYICMILIYIICIYILHINSNKQFLIFRFFFQKKSLNFNKLKNIILLI